MKKREEGYVGKRMMGMAVPGRRKRGRPRRGWMIWREKKRVGAKEKTKSIGSNREYFFAVATPNREKSKEEELQLLSLTLSTNRWCEEKFVYCAVRLGM